MRNITLPAKYPAAFLKEKGVLEIRRSWSLD
jgi:hypothetical protein